MNQENQQPPHAPVEQSWIVLDDNGWVSASRPPTVSPSRHTPRFDDDDEEEPDTTESRFLRRIGMDREIREALELAEQSLEMAGSANEFSHHEQRTSLEDEEHRENETSHPSARFAVSPAQFEDRYNGRGDPTVKGNRVLIVAETEHVAFKKLRPETPNAQCSDMRALNADIDAATQTKSSATVSGGISSELPTFSSLFENCGQCAECANRGRIVEKDDELEQNWFQWILGIYGGSSMAPLILTHAVTLVVGLYLGNRKSSNPQSQPAPNNPTSPISTTSN